MNWTSRFEESKKLCGEAFIQPKRKPEETHEVSLHLVQGLKSMV
jgi:hypothetical protein